MRPLASRSFRAMGTEVRLFLDAPDAMEALVTAERDVAALERRFSRFIAGSELSRVNAADGSWVRISPDMAEVLDAAAAMHRATGGLFDPLVLAALERAGYDRTFAEVGDAGPRAAARRERPTFAAVERHGDAVRLPRGARMDLGGIVKGWAADRIADDLALVGPALGDLALSLAVLHAALLLGDRFAHFTPSSLVIPFTAAYRPEWTGLGIIALYLAAAVFWSVEVRPRLGYKAWRAFHYLAFVAYALALLHGMFSGTDSGSAAMRAMYAATGSLAVWLLVLRIRAAVPSTPALRKVAST